MSLAVTPLRSGALGFWVRLNHHLVMTKQLFTGSSGPHFPTVFWTNSLCCHSIKRNRLVHLLNAHDELMQWTRPEPNFIWTPIASTGRSELIFPCLLAWVTMWCLWHINRQTGMGLVSTMARIGSMAAPAVLILDEVMSLSKISPSISQSIKKSITL